MITKLLAKNPILLTQILDRLLLVSVHPTATSKNWKGSSILAIVSLIVAGVTNRYLNQSV
jgi:hypothetical protein